MNPDNNITGACSKGYSSSLQILLLSCYQDCDSLASTVWFRMAALIMKPHHLLCLWLHADWFSYGKNIKRIMTGHSVSRHSQNSLRFLFPQKSPARMPISDNCKTKKTKLVIVCSTDLNVKVTVLQPEGPLWISVGWEQHAATHCREPEGNNKR